MEYGKCNICRGKMYKIQGNWRHIFSHNDNDHKGVVTPNDYES